VLSRDQIIELISSEDARAFDPSIDIRTAQLHKKLNTDIQNPPTSAPFEIADINSQKNSKNNIGKSVCQTGPHFSSINDIDKLSIEEGS
jgi:hypothetical protein